jgi:ubiquinone/menaquinone biosynthesis C-methylase UbiE
MLFRLYRLLTRIPVLGPVFLRAWYQYLAGEVRDTDWGFMNYGYADPSAPDGRPVLEPDLALERYSVNLYHHVASAVDITGKEVLEIGSGRGAGAAYVYKYLRPKTLVGVDFAPNAVDLSNQNHAGDGLSYQVGNAEALSFGDHSFDVVLNVESAHCYKSIATFLEEVYRVLRPDGYLLIADLGPVSLINTLRAQMAKSRLQVIGETDITPNVLAAMEADHQRKLAVLQAKAPRLIVKLAVDFMGAPGSRIWRRLESGKYSYVSSVLQKIAA